MMRREPKNNVIITSRVVEKNRAANNPIVPTNPRTKGSNRLWLEYAEGKLTRPIITTNTNKIGCTSFSEVSRKLIEPTPPHIKKENSKQCITQSPEKNIPNLSFI